MPVRPDWYSEHPSACTCASCVGNGRAGRRRVVTCTMCMGTGKTISRWSEELGGKLLRCPKCFGSGRVTRHFERADRPHAAAPDKPGHPGGVLDQAEEIGDKYTAESAKPPQHIPNSHQSHLRLKKPLNPNVPAEARRRVHRRAVRLRKPLNPKVPVGARRRVHRKAVRHRKPLNPKALAEAHLQVHRGAVRLKKPLHPKALVEVHRRVVVIRGSAEQNRRQLAARLKKRHSLRVLVGAGPDVES